MNLDLVVILDLKGRLGVQGQPGLWGKLGMEKKKSFSLGGENVLELEGGGGCVIIAQYHHGSVHLGMVKGPQEALGSITSVGRVKRQQAGFFIQVLTSVVRIFVSFCFRFF